MTKFKLGDRVSISGTTNKIKEYPSTTYKESPRLPVRRDYPNDKFFSEGVIIGSRTVQDGTTFYEEDDGGYIFRPEGGYIFRPERGTAKRMWIVAFDMRMKPVMCSDNQVTLLESEEIKVGDIVENIEVPDLDYRKVIAVGESWIFLDFQLHQLESGELPSPLPIERYRKVKP